PAHAARTLPPAARRRQGRPAGRDPQRARPPALAGRRAVRPRRRLHEGRALIRIGRVLVPTDFSEQSKKALRYAIELAEGPDAELVLLHVFEAPAFPIDPGVGATLPPPVAKELKQAVAERLEAWRASELPRGRRAAAVLREGRPAPEICAAAR